MVLLGFISLLWLLFRTGTKPSRIVYPCQRAALTNTYILFRIIFPFQIVQFFRSKKFLTTTLCVILIISTVTENFNIGQAGGASDQEVNLTLYSKNATATPASDIFVVNGATGNDDGVSKLIDLMGSHGLLFYKSETNGTNRGPNGLIAAGDVVLIKVNNMWNQRGGTNTDLIKALIQAIVDHPDTFRGEIVIVDNWQWNGKASFDYAENNAENHSQSMQDVVNMFANSYKVSTFPWRTITKVNVTEYSSGDLRNGYVVNQTVDSKTRIKTSYPKFQTRFGTYVSFKEGIWNSSNGNYNKEKLKLINVPVLKSHNEYGVTACVKNYMGVLSDIYGGGFSEGHETVGDGSMGTLMVQTRFPTLNILDAIWVNANPAGSAPPELVGPESSYSAATKAKVIMASTDPVALDYWSAKHVLMQTAVLIGYNDTTSIDPDKTTKVVGEIEAFGVWLRRSMNILKAHGYQVTVEEDHMNVYVISMGHKLNLRVKDWDLTDSIQGAYVYKDSDVKVSDVNGWANWTGVSGTVNIKVKWFGFWVNGTFTVTVDGNKTIDVRCKIFDVTITCEESLQQAVLQDVNVTIYNATLMGEMIRTGTTGPNGKVNLDNVPNGTLTLIAYDGNNLRIAQVPITIVSEGQQETIVCDENYVTTQFKWEIHAYED